MNLKISVNRFCFAVLFLLSSLTAFAEGTFTISGTIQNASASEVKLSVYKNHLTAIAEDITSNITNGNYKLTGKLNNPDYFL